MLRFVIFFSIFVLLAAGAIYFVFHAHFLRVASVEVSGSFRAEEIKELLINGLMKSSGVRFLLGPDNILFWSPEAVKKDFLPAAWLSELSLKRDWGQRKIIISAKAREPWLLWCLQTQTNADYTQTNAEILRESASSQRQSAITNCYWLDEQGIVFAFAPEAEGFLIPKVLEQSGRQQLAFGQPFYDGSQLVKNILGILNQIKNSSLAVSRFVVGDMSLEELTAETDGPKLYFSSRFSLRNFDGILADLAGRLNFSKLEYVDFRVENRIYYK